MAEIILFATVGRSDLQLVLTDPHNQMCRAEIHRSHARALHQALADNRFGYEVNADHVELPVNRGEALTWDAQQNGIAGELRTVTDAYNRLIFVPAKLARIVQELRMAHQVVATVMFNTHRQCERIGPPYFEEPFLTGPILSGWLAEVFGFKVGQQSGHVGAGIAGWVNILDGDMRLTGSGRDAPLHREAARRMDATIRESLTWTDNPEVHACLALGGGIPGTKDVLVASARYRFQNRILLRGTHSDDRQVEALSEEAPTSQASLQSREQATTLIWKGDFAGAYGAVQYLESDAYERDWVTRVEQANRYFLGLLGADEDLPTYIQALLNKPRCLLVAMRVEAALWAGRLPEAITWSWSFAEAALLDFIEQLPYVDKLDELNRTLMCRPGHTPPSDLTSDKGWCLKSQLGTQSVYTVMTQGREQKWYRAIERETNIGELRCYRDAMRGSGPLSAISPYILRNVCAHSVLDQQTMATAEGLFVTANIWSGQPQGRIGHYFLECHLTKSILRKLGVADPSKCYLELVQGLTTDLAQYEL